MSNNCLFCKIANKEIDTDVVYEDDEIMAFKDINPKAPIHFLFIPKRHVSTLNSAGEGDIDILGKILIKIKEAAKEHGIAEDGYRVVINCNKNAGQEVFHIHAHLLGGRPFAWPPG
ncbi:MAG: histidine triad nucleotide-binding protein [Candidatus Omnitrophota bacterium]